jgi:hypothetical protein
MKISREELYRRVWLTPVRKLAKEFDISDVGLAKACRKHGIPLPPVGYWAKVQHGKNVTQPSLPSEPVATVVLEANRNRPKKLDLGPLSEKAKTLQIHPPRIGEQLTAFAQATLNRLRAGKPDERGLIHSHGGDVFDCAVGPKSLERVCRLFHAIETALPEVTSRLASGDEPARLNFEHDGQSVVFLIVEQVQRTEIPPDKKAKTLHYWPEYSYAATGKLTFEIDDFHAGQKRWADGVRLSLEDRLSEVVFGLVAAARAKKQWKIDLELQHQRWAEEARQREERERKTREEAEFKRQLLADGQTWRACQTATAYVEQVRLALEEQGPTLPAKSLEWLDHAAKAIREMDPFARQVQRLRA